MQKILPFLAVSLALVAMSANAAVIAPPGASIESVARTNAIDSPSVQQRTTGTDQVSSSSQGTLVWTKAGVNYNMASTSSSATARTSLGVNKAGVSATEMTPIRPANLLDYGGTMNTSAWSTAYASSLWRDWFYVGGTSGRGLQVTARGYVEFSSAFNSLGNKYLPWHVGFGTIGQTAYNWEMRFTSHQPSSIPNVLFWEHTFNITTGEWFEFGNSLFVNVGSQGGYLNHMDWSTTDNLTISGILDSMHTSVFTGFEVLGEPDLAIQNSSGDLRKIDGKYTYEASILEGLTPGNPAVVAAPSTLMLSSLTFWFLLVHRRRRLSA